MGARVFLHKCQGPRNPIRDPPGRRSPAWCVRDQSPSSRLHSSGSQRAAPATLKRGSGQGWPLSAVQSLRDPPRSAASACLLHWAFCPTRGCGSDAAPSTRQGCSLIGAPAESGKTALASAVPRRDRLPRCKRINLLGPWEDRLSRISL
ncbi:hypothetical protein NDU88_006583 [Pleurodeles waltl]|uniref:Uncharacterized protein n=1 Tax=Pleurodeles waltl TaxID=8319 RepID=A0AAV7SPY2_PLEWA|nr:hypothetical protein NDU88_006583 [Pleurodeles waltl]